MFQVELAHWFYIDNLVVEHNLPKVSFKDFCPVIFKHVPFLRKHLKDMEEVIEKFREYKSNVPTYGAIILDIRMEKCLMVQGMGSRNNWGFPKGKVNEHEVPLVCAIREVKEEIGYDCTCLIKKDDFIEKNFRGTEIKLYIVAGVDENQEFTPATKNEIRYIKWFNIDHLPESFDQKHEGGQSFFMAIPFVKDLREWIRKKRLEEIKAMRVKQREKGRQRSERESVKDGKEVPVKRPTGRNAFWTKHWEHVQLDWKTIWAAVDQELGLVQ